MATFVVAHGAWSAGWAWKKMHPLMQARGHRLITPTMTGLGERGDRARSRIAKLIYLDAFAPNDGDSVMNLLPAAARALRQVSPDGMIPPVPMPPDTPQEDRDWCAPLRLPQPAK